MPRSFFLKPAQGVRSVGEQGGVMQSEVLQKLLCNHFRVFSLIFEFLRASSSVFKRLRAFFEHLQGSVFELFEGLRAFSSVFERLRAFSSVFERPRAVFEQSFSTVFERLRASSSVFERLRAVFWDLSTGAVFSKAKK